jgi:hypothetical protein
MMYRVEVYVNEDFAKEFLIQADDPDHAEEIVRGVLDIQLSTEEL